MSGVNFLKGPRSALWGVYGMQFMHGIFTILIKYCIPQNINIVNGGNFCIKCTPLSSQTTNHDEGFHKMHTTLNLNEDTA